MRPGLSTRRDRSRPSPAGSPPRGPRSGGSNTSTAARTAAGARISVRGRRRGPPGGWRPRRRRRRPACATQTRPPAQSYKHLRRGGGISECEFGAARGLGRDRHSGRSPSRRRGERPGRRAPPATARAISSHRALAPDRRAQQRGERRVRCPPTARTLPGGTWWRPRSSPLKNGLLRGTWAAPDTSQEDPIAALMRRRGRVVEAGDHHRRLGLGPGQRLDRDLGHRRERPERAGEQLAEVVAGDVLDHPAARLEGLAAAGHRRHAEEMVARGAGLDPPRSRQVRREHAADRAGARRLPSTGP